MSRKRHVICYRGRTAAYWRRRYRVRPPLQQHPMRALTPAIPVGIFLALIIALGLVAR